MIKRTITVIAALFLCFHSLVTQNVTMQQPEYLPEESKRDISLRLPESYDQISGMDKKEAELNLAKELQTFQCGKTVVRPFIIENGELQQLSQSVYVLSGKTLFTKGMNSNLYVEQTDSNTFHLLYDRKFPEESIANLFNHPYWSEAECLDLQVRQTVYGGKSLSYDIKLSDLHCFMRDDYETYTGIEKCTAEVAEFSVIYKSKLYNCHHLLYIQTTPQNLFDKTEPLKAVFYTFIPNHNIKNLYKEHIENRKYPIKINN